jgi:hypothetical protein
LIWPNTGSGSCLRSRWGLACPAGLDLRTAVTISESGCLRDATE